MNAMIAVWIRLAAAGVLIAAAVMMSGRPAGAAPQPAAPMEAGSRATEREVIPGAYLMSADEREQYRARMQRARDPQEKARIRAEHYRTMDERARNVGLALRDAPPAPAKGEARRGAGLHDVCFSCHGPERYVAAKRRAASYLVDALAAAGGIEEVSFEPGAKRAPTALPANYPKMGRSQVKDVAGLKKAVLRWNDYFNPKLSEQELEDLVAYLNAAYYKF